MLQLAWRLASPVALLLLWEVASRAGLLDALLFPPPSAVMLDLGQMIGSGYLWRALTASLMRLVAGFALALSGGFVVGAAMARVPLLDRLLDPLIELLRPISPLALYPLAILWFGIGDGSKVFVIALAACFPVVLNTYAGVRSIDPNMFRVAQSLGATPCESFLRIALPGSLPHVFTGARLACGVALIVIVAAEMVGASSGIGYMVLEAQQTFRTERLFAGIIVIGAIGILTDLGFQRLRRRLLPWRIHENR
jgi:ABC-type nitrate/sulfonate/bicarbonate transport system permease component